MTLPSEFTNTEILLELKEEILASLRHEIHDALESEVDSMHAEINSVLERVDRMEALLFHADFKSFEAIDEVILKACRNSSYWDWDCFPQCRRAFPQIAPSTTTCFQVLGSALTDRSVW
eukprot:TRINITY_DN31535_c0_g1_i2.p1 TRINITY_DN31535_c0_g1~~TRINITY_DN31535_c0_g1_i2.p1  ORF type:complete len:119 (+),score=16.24 TRINITY_DN31535_c0_g1_i2:2-358(+)